MELNNEINYKEVGLRIKNRRKQLAMTQKQLSELVGLSEGSVSRYESGSIKDAPTQKLYEFAEALKVEFSYIIGFVPSTNKYKMAEKCLQKIQSLDDEKAIELIEIINKMIKLMK